MFSMKKNQLSKETFHLLLELQLKKILSTIGTFFMNTTFLIKTTAPKRNGPLSRVLLKNFFIAFKTGFINKASFGPLQKLSEFRKLPI